MKIEDVQLRLDYLYELKRRSHGIKRHQIVCDIANLEDYLDCRGIQVDSKLSRLEVHRAMLWMSRKHLERTIDVMDSLHILSTCSEILLDLYNKNPFPLHSIGAENYTSIKEEPNPYINEFLKEIDAKYEKLFQKEVDNGNFEEFQVEGENEALDGYILLFTTLKDYIAKIRYHKTINDYVSVVHETGHIIEQENLIEEGYPRDILSIYQETYPLFLEKMYVYYLIKDKQVKGAKKLFISNMNELIITAITVKNVAYMHGIEVKPFTELEKTIIDTFELVDVPDSDLDNRLQYALGEYLTIYFLSKYDTYEEASYALLNYLRVMSAYPLKDGLQVLQLDREFEKCVEPSLKAAHSLVKRK